MMKNSIAFLTAAAGLLSLAIAPAFARSPDMLQYIPEDSPYAFAITRPLPKAVADKFEPVIADVLDNYNTVVGHVIDEHLNELREEGGSADEIARARAVGDVVLELLSLDGLRAAGLKENGRVALYGHGLLPVMRLELSDVSAFDKTISRIEEESGFSFSTASSGRTEYRFADFEGLRALVLVDDDQAVFTVVPTTADDSVVRQILGVDKPRRSLQKARTMRDIRKNFGYTDFMTGFFDNVRIAEIVLGDRTALDEALFESLTDGEESPLDSLSPVCKDEIMSLVQVAPRMVMGYTDISTAAIASSVTLELRDDIASDLATIPAPVPGMGSDPGGLVSFGLSTNVLNLRSFIENRLTAVEEDPYECELLSGIQEMAAEMRAGLAQPIPPVVYGIRGFFMNILDVEGFDIATETPPTDIDASLLFAVENAQSLMMLAAMLDPQIAAMELQADGKAVELNLPQLAEFGMPTFVAMIDNALSVGIGDGGSERAEDAIRSKAASPAPFMSVAFDAARYYTLLGEAMIAEEAAGEGEGEAMPAESREALGGVMSAFADLYERLLVDVYFNERGIDVNSDLTLKD